MLEDTKNIELTYGTAILIAKRANTSPQYVRTVLRRYRSGHRFYGVKTKNILKLINKYS